MIFRKKLSKKAEAEMTPAQQRHFYETGKIIKNGTSKENRSRMISREYYWNHKKGVEL